MNISALVGHDVEWIGKVRHVTSVENLVPNPRGGTKYRIHFQDGSRADVPWDLTISIVESAHEVPNS